MAKRIVFLSSVTQGLEAYREAVFRAIEGLDGYHCRRMEDFGARDERADAFCRTAVAECDIFVAIVGHQYGSIEKSSGQSYCEREYEAAVEAGKPRLVFAAPYDFPVQAHLIENDLKRQQQSRFRQRVLDDRTVAFFSTKDDLGKSVLQAIQNCRLDLEETLNPKGSNGPLGGQPKLKSSLLFPFVTVMAGWDTAITISNVSADPFGTPVQNGSVQIYFYGMNAPEMQTVSDIAGGRVFSLLLSSIVREFNGYVVAVCDFAPARGFAVLGPIPFKNGTTGYLAEIMNG